MSCFKRLLVKFVVASFLMTTIFSYGGFSTASTSVSTNETNGKRIIVKYKDESQAELFKESTKSKLNLSKLISKKKLKKGNIELIEVDGDVNINVVLDELKNNNSVEFAQEDYQVRLGSAPNDTFYNEQWGLKNNGQAINGITGNINVDINAEKAWNITKGNSNTVVAVLDTDLDANHEDLNQNIWVNIDEIPGNGIDDDSNGYIDDVKGFDFANNLSNIYSLESGQNHATHLAGIISAVNNNNKGISGVAPEVKIMPLKFVDGGVGYTSDAIEAIQYAEANGATIANCSWWTSENNIALKDAISSSNMLFIAAAGNAATNNDITPVYPASFSLSNVISVAALDNQGNLASFSNYGLNSVDIAAPGKDIISTIPGNEYGYLSGTSMSTAYASGVAALIKSQNPLMTASQIKDKIKATAVSSQNLSEKIMNGSILNAFYSLGGQQVNTPEIQAPQTEDDTNSTKGTGTGEPPQDPEQYAIWKQNLLNLESSDSQVSMLEYSNGRMYNEYIEYVVASSGLFTVGTTGGNPDNAYDNNKRMLYGHPSPWSSYTTVKLDDTNYIYRPTTQYQTPNTADLSNTSEYNVGNVSVKQLVSIVKSTSSQREDTVQVKYIIKNSDSVNHSVGLRIMMDTMLGYNDAAPFRLPGIGAVTTETELTGDNIPEYWQAFDSLANPTVISQGTLLRSLDNKPDKVQFTNWGRANSNPWMNSVYTGSSNGDSAVSIYWNPKALTPGETREYVTYYGLSELQQDLRPPLAVSITGASNIIATESGYNPNPFTITSYIMNNGSGSANNVKARIELPEGLRLAGGQQNEVSLGTVSPNTYEKQVSWEVEIQPDSIDRNLTYSVIVSADNTATKTLIRNIFIPASIEINPIDNVQVECTESTATVRWTVPAGAGGTVALSNLGGYYAYLPYDGGITVAATNTVNKSLYFSGLSADTSYNYTVFASYNGRTYSKMGSFKTNSSPEAKDIVLIHGMMGAELWVDHDKDESDYFWMPLPAGGPYVENNPHKVWPPRMAGPVPDLTLYHDLDMIECDDYGRSVYPSVGYHDNNSGFSDQWNNVREHRAQWKELTKMLDEYVSFKNAASRVGQGDRDYFKIHRISYDWRKDGEISSQKISDDIDNILAKRRALGVTNPKVTVIAYSMGGIIAANYISKGNADKFDKFISIGTPYLGSAKMLYAIQTGRLMDDYKRFLFESGNTDGISDALLSSKIKEYAPNMWFNYQCLPAKRYFDYSYYEEHYGNIGPGFVDKNIYKYDFWWGDPFANPPYSKYNRSERIDTYDDTEKFLKILPGVKKYSEERFRYNNPFIKAREFHDFDMLAALRSVDAHVIVGVGEPTIFKVEEKFYEKDGKQEFIGIDDIRVTYFGDGTSAVASASLGEQYDRNRTYFLRKDSSHGELCNNPYVVQQVQNILANDGKSSVVLADNISHERPSPRDEKFKRIDVECPVELHIYGEDGKHMGPNQYGNIDKFIDSADYHVIGDRKIAFVRDDNYDIKLKGTGDGKMTLTIKLCNGYETVEKTVRYDDVKVLPTAIYTSTTDIDNNPVLNADWDGNGSVDEVIEPSVILDTASSSDKVAPTVEMNLNGEMGNNNWYKSDIDVSINATDDVSGINKIEYALNTDSKNTYSGPFVLNQDGNFTIYAMAVDKNRNASDIIKKEVSIDKTVPVINCSIKDGEVFLLRQDVRFNFNVSDSMSGVESFSSTLADNSLIDTSTVGPKIITIRARDNAGNEIIKNISYNVTYSFSGILQPVNSDGSSIFRLGSTIPVKFKLTDVNGNFVSDAISKLYIEKIDYKVQGTVIEAYSTSVATTGNLFRYDNIDNQYIFNLGTKELSAGIWTLKIVLDDGTIKEYKISLKG